jgi:hypothetical protein
MSRIFYEMEQAAEKLGVDVAEIEGMVDLRELTLVQVGARRLVHVRDVEEISQRVERGGPLRVRREYLGAMVPEAVREAAKHLGVAEEDLVYEVLQKGLLRMPGVEGRPARIAVELPEEAAGFPEESEPDPPTEEEPSEAQVIRRSGNVSLYEVLRSEASRSETRATEQPVTEESMTGESTTEEAQDAGATPDTADAPVSEETPDTHEAPDPVEAPVSEAMLVTEEMSDTGAFENVGAFYAPEQVARLLGRKPSDVNLWIYRGDLTTVNINDYLWIPEEAVLELLEREPVLGTRIPPKPFHLVVPTEETRTGSYVYRLGQGEVADQANDETLRHKITELERLVEDLRGQILRDVPTVRDGFFADETLPEKDRHNLDHAHSA